MATKRLYTLTEVSQKTGISMPTLQRYKKRHQKRLPSVGKGRTQRYPREAFAAFEAIRDENLTKRGRPPKKRSAAKGARTKVGTSAKKRASARSGAEAANLITLLEIGRRTGISYPTLLRYVKLHGDRIPHVGSGRKRRFPPEAVAVFRKIRAASRRGPKSRGVGGGRVATDQVLARRIRELDKAHREISKQLDGITRLLKRPLRITIRGD